MKERIGKHVAITLGRSAYAATIELDGHAIDGVESFELFGDGDDVPARLTVTLLPRTLTVDGFVEDAIATFVIMHNDTPIAVVYDGADIARYEQQLHNPETDDYITYRQLESSLPRR